MEYKKVKPSTPFKKFLEPNIVFDKQFLVLWKRLRLR